MPLSYFSVCHLVVWLKALIANTFKHMRRLKPRHLHHPVNTTTTTTTTGSTNITTSTTRNATTTTATFTSTTTTITTSITVITITTVALTLLLLLLRDVPKESPLKHQLKSITLNILIEFIL
jgi:hypothetical protein